MKTPFNQLYAKSIKNSCLRITVLILFTLSNLNLSAQQKSFPTAYGAGSLATGGRGGVVIHVTNLNNSGPGSFREAFTTPGTRTIVFDVSGTINCLSTLSTAYGNVTVAGQTAPEGGITFTGNVGNAPLFKVSGKDNMIFRYLRIRPTFNEGGGDRDAMQFFNCTNVIVDHCSTSWGGDESLSVTGTTNNITVQNCILAESKTGSIIGNPNQPHNASNLSMHGNLFFQIDHRHPNTPTNHRVDVINNVIWGYGHRTNRPATGFPKLNEINNYWMSNSARPLGEMGKIDWYGTEPQIYSKGNLHLPTTVTNPNLPNNNNTWTAFGTSNGAYSFNYNGTSYYDDDPAPSSFFTSVQHPLLGNAWPIMTAFEAFEHAKSNTGACKTLDASGDVVLHRDVIDDYYLTNVNNGTLLTITYPFTMSGKSHYENYLNNISSIPINTRPANYDVDNDGMADLWENNTFGDTSRTASADEDGNGYTNLEEFLNEIDSQVTGGNIEYQVVVNSNATDNTICEGETTTLSASDADSYTWTPGDLTGESIDVSPLTTTTYTVTGTHSDGSTSTDSIVITVTPLPIANAGNDVEICQGNSVTLSASGGTSYLWSTGATTQSISVNPNITTTYSVVTTENNCSSEPDEITVTVNPLPTVDAGLDLTINFGESTVLTANGADSYVWNTGETTQSITVSPTIETTYTVTGTTGSCENSDSVTVFLIGSEVVANAGEDQTICNGSETTITATGGAAYVWSTGETTASINVSPAETTTYSVTVFDESGTVSDTDDIIVNVTDNPVANAGDDLEICQGVSVTLTASGGSNYVWSTGATTQSITVNPNSTTTYSVEVIENNCSSIDEVIVTVNALPNVDAGVDVSITEGETTTLSASGADSYLWNTGETTTTIEVSPLSTTTYSVTGFSNNCESTAEVTVTVETETVIADAGSDVSICEGESTILTASGGASYQWNTGETTSSIEVNPNTTTTYSVTVFNSLGTSSDTDEVIVTVNALPNVDAGVDVSITEGETTTLSASGADSYLWNTGETTSTIEVSPLNTTTYSVTGFSNSCESTAEVTVTVEAETVIADAGSDVSICEGESTILTASGGASYQWNTGETTSSIEVNPNTTTTYSVTVFNSLGTSSDTDEVIVTVNALPNVDAGVDVSITEGETTTLSASGADSYLWNTGETTSTIEVSPLSTTTYSVTGFSNNCESSAEVTVTVETEMVIADAGSDVSICEGESTILTASGGASYQWNTGETTSSIEVNPNTTTTYSVTVFNSLGTSSDTDEVIVTVNALPNVDAGVDVSITEGETTTLSASGADSYLWNTGETTSTIEVSPLSTTTYSVTGFSNNCESTAEVTVTVETETVIADAGSDVSICEGESTILTASGGASYQWNTGETTSSIEVNPNTTTTYSVAVFNSLGTSSDTDEVIVTVNAIPVANAGNDIEVCQGTEVTLSASGGNTYLWNTGETSQTITVSPNSTTTYSVEVTQNTCSSTDDVTVIVNNLPNINAGPNMTITDGESTLLTATGADSYVWSTGETTPTIEVSPLETTLYSVTGFSNGCEATDEVTVIVEPIVFSASAGEDQFICEGTSTILTASEGDAYLWSTGETTQSITVSPYASETYWVTVFEGTEQAQDDVSVFVNLNPNVVIVNGGEVDILEGEFITLSASGANTYEWNNGATQPNIAVSPTTTTTYSVTGYINNCSDEKSITVNVLETVEAYAGEDLTICDNETVTLTAIGGEGYLWSTGEETQSINVTPGTDTEYSVLVYNELSSDEATVMVYVNDCSSVEIPQADEEFGFLVYQDASADVIKVQISGMNRVDVDQLVIYDITGKVVYNEQIRTDENTQSLDKEINASPFSRGIYIVRLVYDDTELLKKIPIR